MFAPTMCRMSSVECEIFCLIFVMVKSHFAQLSMLIMLLANLSEVHASAGVFLKIGPVFITPHILLSAGVCKDLVEVNDCASDNLVLRLCSSETRRKVSASGSIRFKRDGRLTTSFLNNL
uniref:Uncharacterized protein n=1 Tax=Spongospora subterranea TaxID=70186 RepID=A0A0H5QPX4_9EUKA|eukprot:CRZ03466.1 hypothetical protein [Spongospora subterranea]